MDSFTKEVQDELNQFKIGHTNEIKKLALHNVNNSLRLRHQQSVEKRDVLEFYRQEVAYCKRNIKTIKELDIDTTGDYLYDLEELKAYLQRCKRIVKKLS